MNHVLLELNCYFEVVKSSFQSEREEQKQLRRDLIEKRPEPAPYTLKYFIRYCTYRSHCRVGSRDARILLANSDMSSANISLQKVCLLSHL